MRQNSTECYDTGLSEERLFVSHYGRYIALKRLSRDLDVLFPYSSVSKTSYITS